MNAIVARPLRLEVSGGHYHVMARGNAKQPVFVDDTDRQHFLNGLYRTSMRLDWQVLAYCLMANHYHLLVETRQASLARGMRDVNGGYAQGFNRRHSRVGHVFQGRYKALLVERGSYLLEVLRYIVRNPVTAGLCASPGEWHWSSHRATLGMASAPPCLAIHATLEQFDPDLATSRARYAQFVAVDGAIQDDGWMHPIVAGTDAFARKAVGRETNQSLEVPRSQRTIRSLRQYQQCAVDRNEAMRWAHASGAYSLAEIGRHFGVHYSTVSRICRTSENRRASNDSLDTVRQFKI